MVRPRRVTEVPLIPMLQVENARQGFLPRAEFEALAAKIVDEGVRDFLEFFWWTGMRPDEIRQLTWQMFDVDSWTLSLDPRAAKTGRGRVIALEGPLRAIVERRLAARQLECSLIFHRAIKGKRGHPVRDFAPLWRAALSAAKLAPGLRPYDLRRSAIRNLIRAPAFTRRS
jgi:integrase